MHTLKTWFKECYSFDFYTHTQIKISKLSQYDALEVLTSSVSADTGSSNPHAHVRRQAS